MLRPSYTLGSGDGFNGLFPMSLLRVPNLLHLGVLARIIDGANPLANDIGDGLLFQAEEWSDLALRHAAFGQSDDLLIAFASHPNNIQLLGDLGECFISLRCFDGEERAHHAEHLASMGIIASAPVVLRFPVLLINELHFGNNPNAKPLMDCFDDIAGSAGNRNLNADLRQVDTSLAVEVTGEPCRELFIAPRFKHHCLSCVSDTNAIGTVNTDESFVPVNTAAALVAALMEK